MKTNSQSHDVGAHLVCARPLRIRTIAGARKVRPYACISALLLLPALQSFSPSALSQTEPLPSTPLSVDLARTGTSAAPAAAPDKAAVASPSTKSSPVAPATPDSASPATNAAPATPKFHVPKSMFFDDEDGWLDASGFLMRPYGFIPLLIPITEPAVGYGLMGGPVFIKQGGFDHEGEPISPTVTMAGGAWTEGGTKALFAGNSKSWLDGKLQTVGGGAWADVHLKFSGFGKLTSEEINYAIRMWGGGVRGTYKLGKSKWHTGLGYLYLNTKTRLEPGPGWPSNIPVKDFNTTLAGIAPTLIYDGRDNVFTPTRGLYAEATVPIHSTIFGGDRDYEILQLTLLGFHPLIKDKLFGGVRLVGQGSWGDAPFFTRPYVDLRGAEAMRYQGQYMAEGEVELRWQFSKRFSLVGFGGYGYTRYNIDNYEKDNHVTTGGVGFRYLIARLFGLHMGVDVAFGPDDPIFYITFGSAWARP